MAAGDRNKYFDANYARRNGGIAQLDGATLGVEVIEMLKYYVHDPEILRLTSEHGIKAIDIPDNGAYGQLDHSHDVALNEQSRDAVIAYWSVFWRDYTSGAIDYDVNGLFRPEFDLSPIE